MSEINYPPNSHAYKQSQQQTTPAEKQGKKVIQGTAKVKKKSELSKAAGSLISEDIRSVGSYVLMEVIIPSLKNTIVNVVKDGIEMIFFGEAKRSDRKSSNSYVSYSRYADPRESDRGYGQSSARYDYDELVFDSYAEADKVLDEMGATIQDYGFVTIGDLYEFAGATPPPYTSVKYGWDSIRYAEIKRVRGGGYGIELPKARPRRG